jgi:TET-Associated Glycosyltransferase
MIMMNDFAVFILTHGRPAHIITLTSLRRQGYTGPIYFVVDDQDKSLREYQKRFKDAVKVFSKDQISKTFDLADNFDENRAVIYARNACWDIAQELGLKYFVQLDDDYVTFLYKFTGTLEYKERPIKNLDRIFEAVLEFYKGINALTVAFFQNGDFVGGADSTTAKQITCKRKAMNSFFCSTERRFNFIGKVNEDVNTYALLGHQGKLFLSVGCISHTQSTTQANEGGMTDLYLDKGTYYKSFYSVMFCPSFVTVGTMGYKSKRLHHKFNWEQAVPKIIRADQKKLAA